MAENYWKLEILKPEHVDGCRIFSDRTEMIKYLSFMRGGVVAELGVLVGAFSAILLKYLTPRKFHAYDLFDAHTREVYQKRFNFNGKSHMEYYHDQFPDAKHSGCLETFSGDSSSLLAQQPDKSYDVIYIDGDHTLAGAKRDTDCAVKKIKDSGMLIFNDYIMWAQHPKHPKGYITYGVVYAVNNLCVNEGWRMHAFALHASMYCDVALVRR